MGKKEKVRLYIERERGWGRERRSTERVRGERSWMRIKLMSLFSQENCWCCLKSASPKNAKDKT